MVNTGDGKGKNTAAIGVLVRGGRARLKCCMIQFMKSKPTDYGAMNPSKSWVLVYPMGDGFTWDTNDRLRT